MSEHDDRHENDNFISMSIESPIDKHNWEVIRTVYEIFGSLENGSVAEDIALVPTGWKCIYSEVDYTTAASYVMNKIEEDTHWCVSPCIDPDGIMMFDKVWLFAEPGSYQYDDPTMTQRKTSTGKWLTALKDID